MKALTRAIGAFLDTLRNFSEGKDLAQLRPERLRSVYHNTVFPAKPGPSRWPLSSDYSPPRTDPSRPNNAYTSGTTGLALALRNSPHVEHLTVSADEFRRFLHEQENPIGAAKRIKAELPNLQSLSVLDDYLTDYEIDSITREINPVKIIWLQGCAIDGRHGR